MWSLICFTFCCFFLTISINPSRAGAGVYDNQFDYKTSSSFKASDNKFAVTYQDGSEIKGLVASGMKLFVVLCATHGFGDVITLGGFSALAPFGGILKSGWEWNGDGILGMLSYACPHSGMRAYI